MITKFWEGIGEKLAAKWFDQAILPAFVFWAGGFLAWTWQNGIPPLTDWMTNLNLVQVGVVLVGALLLLLASSGLMQRLELLLLRLLEGYWPRFMSGLARRLAEWRYSRLQPDELRRGGLAAKHPATRTPDEQRILATLEMRLHYAPSDPAEAMPTALGDILRASESFPRFKYGLDPVVCWPRLWQILPDASREAIGQARDQLNQAVNGWAWSLLFLVWTGWIWWALPLGLLGAFLAYRYALSAAGTYADLFDSAFDLYRWELYKSLHWPLPANPAQERLLGAQLTEYLWRGLEGDIPTFTA